MNYEDDELERMRARREQRRNSGQSSAGRRTNTADARRNTKGSADAFKSGYSGPKGDTSRSSSARGGRDHRGTYRRRRNRDRKKKIILIVLAVIAVLALAVGGAVWYIYQKTWGSLAQVEFDETDVINIELSDEQLESMKGYMTVACFGVDSRADKNGKMNVGKGTNADVNLIASINLETGEIRLVSVFRDTYLNINDKNSYNKINAAYAQGGPEQAVKALNKNLGLNITQYATFNWKAVADAINLLGGVDITLSENEFSWINAYITETVNETGIGSYQLTHAGEVHLDGVQAVAYGRLRLGDTDYARTERQRIILAQAFEKAKKADWATLNCIIQTITPQLATNITPADLVPLARNITKYHMGDTAGFPSARGEMDIGKIGDCVVPKTLEFNVRELHKFLFDETEYEVPSNVLEYSNHIANVTGMSTEGKVIGHVPVDQGVSARSYIKHRAQKAAEEAASKATKASETEEEESTDETEESSVDESGSEGESEFDPEEDWLNGEWDDERFDDEWESNGPGGTGPSTNPSRPGTVRPDRTTEADDENEAGGPGSDGPGGSSGSSNRYEKPGSQYEDGETSQAPGNNVPSGNAPGSGNNSLSGNTSPSGNSTASTEAPRRNNSSSGTGAPGNVAQPGTSSPSGNNAPSGDNYVSGNSANPSGVPTSPGEGGPSGPSA